MKKSVFFTLILLYLPLQILAEKIIECNFEDSIFSNEDSIPNNNFDFSIDTIIVKADFRSAVFYLPTYFNATVFNLHANFYKTQFHAQADFGNAQFNSQADFWNAQFDSLAEFGDAKFHSDANFFRTGFHSDANFFRTGFHSDANFYRTEFDSLADFGSVNFYSLTDFKHVLFHFQCNFDSTQFHSQCNFDSTQFHSQTYFIGANFDSLVNFRSVYFDSLADFSYARFKEQVNFNFTVLPKNLGFENVKTLKEINFRYSRIDSTRNRNGEITKCTIFLLGAEIDKIIINSSLFELGFRDKDTVIKSNYSDTLFVYQQVLQKMKSIGDEVSYRDFDIQLRKIRNHHGQKLYLIVLDFIQDYWWRYGYEKGRVLFWMFSFLALFSVINSFFLHVLQRDIYPIKIIGESKNDNFKNLYFLIKNFFIGVINTLKNNRINQQSSKEKVNIQNFLNLLWNSTIYTSIIFFGLKMDISHINDNAVSGKLAHRVLLIYLMIVYATGLICLGYLINFIIAK